MLYVGYKKYKDQNIEVKNGYSLSFEDLRLHIESDDDQEVESDLCDLSDDWTPVGKIKKKAKKTFTERMVRYLVWVIVISGMTFICYWTLIELYSE
jgi:hypothetical protein